MPPQHPPLTPSPVEAVQIVTLTVYSSPTASQSGLPTLSGGGGASVPIAAIVGGAVGGVALAILLVIIWKHWGRVIQRTERQRRKEVQDLLTMRENTRRNATSGFRPQSQYRPMFALNREGRKVKFLTRTPTSQQRPSNDNNNNNSNNNNGVASPLAPAQTDGEKGKNESAVAPNQSGDIGSMDEIRQISPNFVSSATPSLVREAPPAGAAAGSERKGKGESGERPLLEKVLEAGKSVAVEPESIPPLSPPPILSSPTRTTTPKRAPSPTPTPSGSTSKQTAASTRPSRSVRMRTPRRLPDPPPAPPAYVGRDHARPSSPEPRTSVETSLPRTSSVGSSRTHDSGMRSTSPTPLLPPVPPVPPVLPIPAITPAAPAAEPSAPSSSQPSRQSWSKSPLRNSVLPSDNPVILPRPKNAPRTTESSQPVSPTSTSAHLPSLSFSRSTSQGGEPPKYPHNRFLGSLRLGKGKSPAGMAGVNQRPESDASVYSTND